jgi:DNA mismatch repair protein MutH
LTAAPASIADLIARATALGGMTLGQVATHHGVPIPVNQLRHKGWSGALLETVLGAESGSRPEPDFPTLGVELKTLPVNARGKPKESTYICIAALDGRAESWHTSLVRKKLACVLWVPIEADRSRPLAERRIGTPFLWRPNAEEERQLRSDWEEIMEDIGAGNIDQVSSRQGRWLQLRPKAANARALAPGFDQYGNPAATLPRGFYLRSLFTARLLARHAGLQPPARPAL